MFGRVIFLRWSAWRWRCRVRSSCWSDCPRRRLSPPLRAGADSVAAEAPAPEPPQRQSSGYREALLEADQRGQYAAGVSVNGAPVRMLVDTGASEVCVSASTARRLGLSPREGASADPDGERSVDRFADDTEKRESRRPLYERRRGSHSRARGGGSEPARGKLSQAPGERRATQRDAGPAPVGAASRDANEPRQLERDVVAVPDEIEVERRADRRPARYARARPATRRPLRSRRVPSRNR